MLKMEIYLVVLLILEMDSLLLMVIKSILVIGILIQEVVEEIAFIMETGVIQL
jgi:hypothetical protein